ncbi:cyclin-dependent kinase 2-associated protein 2-like [Pecten maximus]|uniref:cyclin-dependent kinase 2-associated protein 2-like n=1 Tax=Pecten maximus TaxID=6579 RepID=UPI0014580A14|nr:cyclin-dependent kinase 2-associated protein 2-like [Pecten maximus]
MVLLLISKLQGFYFKCTKHKKDVVASNPNSPVTPIISNPGTPRSDGEQQVRATPPPGPAQQIRLSQQQMIAQQHQLHLQQLSLANQSKYTQLLSVIEEMGRDIRPTYAGSKTSSERLKRGIVHARILVRECLMECERSART